MGPTSQISGRILESFPGPFGSAEERGFIGALTSIFSGSLTGPIPRGPWAAKRLKIDNFGTGLGSTRNHFQVMLAVELVPSCPILYWPPLPRGVPGRLDFDAALGPCRVDPQSFSSHFGRRVGASMCPPPPPGGPGGPSGSKRRFLMFVLAPPLGLTLSLGDHVYWADSCPVPGVTLFLIFMLALSAAGGGRTKIWSQIARAEGPGCLGPYSTLALLPKPAQTGPQQSPVWSRESMVGRPYFYVMQ